ncbi:MAG: pyrroline-5-carboxylate reductase [Methanosarcina flavescens]|jgi:pyrroline-5-carboxylate reductase|uniref:Pyrroline-5-carboxylate reductase n=1 Tax=Methanosarcina flavescens TaxID=1715806 RepID=A0A660HS03_9EURY|nr:pyrroline-5-carboxylate reductase [Methanosarcina flavescens]AYK14846.1 pyrroline-5-carboxylate reductase [Methanosarcina flavescens]NLK33059.1 pyrroline-5-carboxylate reductase [Methanosarcina flavescens]
MTVQNRKIGFIGAGKMGSALMQGIIKAGIVKPENLGASDVYEPFLNELNSQLGINVSTDNAVIAQASDILVLAVKPQILGSVLEDLKPYINADKLIISIAAGVPLATYENALPEGTRVVRVMPNIAATVSEAASGISPGKNATSEDLKTALEIFSAVGTAVQVPESLMDAVTGLSGSGPAFIFPVIEAMADGAVLEGMDRKSALTLAAQTVLGAAKMALETGLHPGELKDMVTSPAGTTIQGVRILEEAGIRAAFMNAVIKASERSKELGKK